MWTIFEVSAVKVTSAMEAELLAIVITFMHGKPYSPRPRARSVTSARHD
jgi:hypothetical protein